MSFFTELKRRNVIKVAAAYIIVGWLIMQAGEVMAPALRLPEWVNSTLAFFLILGFPLALFFAWAFEMTPEGLKLEKQVDRTESITHVTGRKLDFSIIGLMAIALVYFAYDKFVLDPSRDTAIAEAARSQVETEPLAEEVTDAPAQNTIAVLPFVNMSDDASNEYFSDGITEELLNLLAKIPELRVTSRSSAFSFKGQNPDIPTVAAKLGVAHVLEGSVRKAGNRVRITTQLIEAGSDVHLWSETYDRELDDVFAIQDEIAEEVVAALKIELLGDAPSSAATDPQAYTLYLQGKHLDSLHTEAAWEASITAFEKAIEIDPEFAPAWAGLSVAQRNRANMSFTNLHSGMAAARESATRALNLDDTLPEAWRALSGIQYAYDWDWSRAVGSVQTALQYGPRNAGVLGSAATAYVTLLGQPETGIEFAEKAVEVDPLDRSALRRLSIIYWLAHRPADTEATVRHILDLYPDQEDSHAHLANALVMQGRPEEAMPLLEADPENYWTRVNRVRAAHDLGRHDDAQRYQQFFIDEYRDVGAYQIAENFAWMGDSNKAFEWLDIAIDLKDGGITMILPDPNLASLHDDPRWEPLLDRIGLLNYWRDGFRGKPGTTDAEPGMTGDEPGMSGGSGSE